MFALIAVATWATISYHPDYQSCKAEIHQIYEDKYNSYHVYDPMLEQFIFSEVKNQQDFRCVHIRHYHEHHNNTDNK